MHQRTEEGKIRPTTKGMWASIDEGKMMERTKAFGQSGLVCERPRNGVSRFPPKRERAVANLHNIQPRLNGKSSPIPAFVFAFYFIPPVTKSLLSEGLFLTYTIFTQGFAEHHHNSFLCFLHHFRYTEFTTHLELLVQNNKTFNLKLKKNICQ